MDRGVAPPIAGDALRFRDGDPRSRLLLLAPSTGFGGGIERVAQAVVQFWPGASSRVDLYRHGYVPAPSGGAWTKADFARRALREGIRHRPNTVLALHIGLLPVALATATTLRARLAMLGIGTEVWGSISRSKRVMLRRCDELLAISAFTAAMMASRTESDLKRISLLPLPIDDGILEAARAYIPRAEPAPMLLTVSRIAAEHRYKGHWAIADSLPAVLEVHPEAEWVVVGDGDDVPALMAHCRELGISHAVRFEGRISDERLVDLYRNAAAFVLPSVADVDSVPPTGEGFGLVYGEAGAFGVPSVASTASGGAAELIRDMETGITVTPGSSNELAGAMIRLLDDGALRTRLGAAVRDRVFARYTREQFARALASQLDTRPHMA